MADASAHPQLRHLDVLFPLPTQTSNYKEDEHHPANTFMLNSDRVSCGEGARQVGQRGSGTWAQPKLVSAAVRPDPSSKPSTCTKCARSPNRGIKVCGHLAAYRNHSALPHHEFHRELRDLLVVGLQGLTVPTSCRRA